MTLPFLGFITGFLISVVVIAGIAGILTHYLYGSIRLMERGIFTSRAAEWPQIFGRIALRAVWRSHGLALNLAISHQGRIEDRLLLLFWHLAQRWGRVSADGVRLDLPLTHKTLAKLVSAQRPSVTNALGELRERRLLLRREDRSWLLPLPIPDELEPLLVRRA